jgi:hypothetical protein
MLLGTRYAVDTDQFLAKLAEQHPTLLNKLDDLQVSNDTRFRLLRGRNVKALEDLLEHVPASYAGDAPGFFSSWEETEQFTATLVEGGSRNATFLRVSPAGVGREIPLKGSRIPDVLVMDDTRIVEMHEAKLGYVRGVFATTQITKDKALLDANPNLVIKWHFYASEASGRIGHSAAVN